jgi:hypothetical protein
LPALAEDDPGAGKSATSANCGALSLLARVAEIERHLGIDKKIAA